MSTEIKTGNKLYVGNVEYRTTEDDLKELFKDYSITEIEIPTRKVRNRSEGGFTERTRGYVFITFGDDVKDLDSIIKKFTDFEFKDRKIYLRYPETKEPIVKGEKVKESSSASASTKSTAETPSDEESKSKKSSTKAKKPIKKTKKTEKTKIPFDQGEKSNDTLYLKNLDFSLKSKDIKEFFESEGETPEWVSVPFLQLPGWVLKRLEARGKDLERRNRGYAFVKLNLNDGETIEDKVAKFNGKSFKDRELLVSVAIDVRTAQGEAGEATTVDETTTEKST